jgi:hypothetical protein
MGHDPKDCGMTKSDFEIYLVGLRIIFHGAVQNHLQTFKTKINTIKGTIRMLGTNSIIRYQKIEFQIKFIIKM